MAAIAPLPSPPNITAVQVDIRNCQVRALHYPKDHNHIGICIDANFVWGSNVIGALVDGGKILPTWDVPEPRALLVIDKGKAHIERESPGEINSHIRAGDWRTATVIQAGPLLVEKGKPVPIEGWKKEGFRPGVFRRTFHTAIGLTKTGKLILAFAKDKTLGEFSKILAKLGAVTALNLDGGSSAHLRYGSHRLGRAYPRTELRILPK